MLDELKDCVAVATVPVGFLRDRALHEVNEPQWLAVMSIPVSVFFSNLTREFQNIAATQKQALSDSRHAIILAEYLGITISLVMVALCLVLCWAIAYAVTLPLKQLAASINRLRDFDF